MGLVHASCWSRKSSPHVDVPAVSRGIVSRIVEQASPENTHLRWPPDVRLRALIPKTLTFGFFCVANQGFLCALIPLPARAVDWFARISDVKAGVDPCSRKRSPVRHRRLALPKPPSARLAMDTDTACRPAAGSRKSSPSRRPCSTAPRLARLGLRIIVAIHRYHRRESNCG